MKSKSKETTKSLSYGKEKTHCNFLDKNTILWHPKMLTSQSKWPHLVFLAYRAQQENTSSQTSEHFIKATKLTERSGNHIGEMKKNPIIN